LNGTGGYCIRRVAVTVFAALALAVISVVRPPGVGLTSDADACALGGRSDRTALSLSAQASAAGAASPDLF